MARVILQCDFDSLDTFQTFHFPSKMTPTRQTATFRNANVNANANANAHAHAPYGVLCTCAHIYLVYTTQWPTVEPSNIAMTDW